MRCKLLKVCHVKLPQINATHIRIPQQHILQFSKSNFKKIHPLVQTQIIGHTLKHKHDLHITLFFYFVTYINCVTLMVKYYKYGATSYTYRVKQYLLLLHTYTTTRDCHELLLVLINIQLEHAYRMYIICLLQSDFKKQKYILAGYTDSA